MKFFGTVGLALFLFAAPAFAQVKQQSMNLGSCGIKDFVGAHFELDKNGKDLDLVSFMPDQKLVVQLPHPAVYVYQSTDAKGYSHYVFDKAEMTLKFEGAHGGKNYYEGELLADGVLVAIVFGREGTAAEIVEDNKQEAESCYETQSEEQEHAPTKKLTI